MEAVEKKSIEIDAVPEEESTMIAGSWMGTYDEDTFYGKSYTADGYYQIKNNLMQFTSYDDGKDYVICTQTNCHHNGKDCAAWINGGSLAKGLARYNKKLYVVDYSLENQKYTLKTADQTGENQKIIAEIPCGDTKKDGWCMASVDDVYYCNNTAWCTLQYRLYEKRTTDRCDKSVCGMWFAGYRGKNRAYRIKEK